MYTLPGSRIVADKPKFSNLESPGLIPNSNSTLNKPKLGNSMQNRSIKLGNPAAPFSVPWGTIGDIGNLLWGQIAPKQHEEHADINAVGNLAGQFGGPWGLLAQGIIQTVTHTGGALDKLSEESAEAIGAGKNGSKINEFARWAGLGAGYFTKRNHTFNRNYLTDDISDSYGNHLKNARIAEDLSGDKNIFTKKSNQFIDKTQADDNLLADISVTNTLRKNSDYGWDLQKQWISKINGGGPQKLVGKNGFKLLSKYEAQRILNSKKKKINLPEINKFQNGGSILIPKGALHAHKHHMEESNPNLAESLTKKGIPVIIKENSEIEQVAEIERDEMILEKSLTEKIEALWKEGSEESMIKAGKLITETLFHNCDDNSGLIKEVE